MRCDNARAAIQDWLDLQGIQPMPTNIRDHIRECDDCRVFIKRWNTIEAGLQAVRSQAPLLTTDLTGAIHARLAEGPKAVERPRFVCSWRLAVAGFSAAALLILLILQLTLGTHGAFPGANGSNPPVAINGPGAFHPGEMPSTNVDPKLPMVTNPPR